MTKQRKLNRIHDYLDEWTLTVIAVFIPLVALLSISI